MLATVDTSGLPDDVEHHLVEATQAHALLDAAKGAQLLVLGSPGTGTTTPRRIFVV